MDIETVFPEASDLLSGTLSFHPLPNSMYHATMLGKFTASQQSYIFHICLHQLLKYKVENSVIFFFLPGWKSIGV